MVLVSLVRGHCSDPSFKNYLFRQRYMALISLEIARSSDLERARCSDLFCAKLLAQGALHGADIPGESVLF